MSPLPFLLTSVTLVYYGGTVIVNDSLVFNTSDVSSDANVMLHVIVGGNIVVKEEKEEEKEEESSGSCTSDQSDYEIGGEGSDQEKGKEGT